MLQIYVIILLRLRFLLPPHLLLLHLLHPKAKPIVMIEPQTTVKLQAELIAPQKVSGRRDRRLKEEYTLTEIELHLEKAKTEEILQGLASI